MTNGNTWRDRVVDDLRYAWRISAKNRGFATVVIATLALGIGANSAIFRVVYSVLFKPLPYVHPEQIYSVEVVVPERRDQIPSLPATVQAFLEWRASNAFAGITALTPTECNLTGDGEPERLGGARVSANFFSFLGVPIERGRAFSSAEERPGNEQVVVISDGLWRRRYGADPTLIGKKIVINGQGHLVVGVAGPSLLMPTGTQLHPLLPFFPRTDIWKPIAPSARELKNESWDHGVLVRASSPAELERGRQQLATILNEMIRIQMPGTKVEVSINLVPIREVYSGKVKLRLLLILAASALLLLTACASVANLFLARVAARTNEFATRIALGASRSRILSQSLTETTLLAVIGGAVGAAFAGYGAGVLASYASDDVRLLAETEVNLPLLLFAIVVTLLTGAACGIVPAWQAYRKDPALALQETARTAVGNRRGDRTRHVLVGMQIALATALLSSAGLLLHSFTRLIQADRGYEVERVLATDLSLFGDRYAEGSSRETFYRELVERVRALPGVLAAGAINNLPAVASSEGASRTIFRPTDADFQKLVLARPVAMIRSVTTGYFAASGSSLRAGRFLTDEDHDPVAVISESLARRLWPGEDPSSVVGRSLRQGDVTGPLVTVVGVVQEARPGALDQEPTPALYRPYAQWASGPMTLVVRTAQDPSSLAPAVRSAIWKIEPNLPVPAIRTMREIVSSAVAQRRFQMMLTSLFGLVALLLGVVGLYGVVSYSVASRTRDIGLRMALGALRADVFRWVFANGMRPVLIGVAVGVAATIAAARVLRSLLFEVTPVDPLSLGTVVLVLALSSCVACYLPARRAAALDPMTALRHD
jgi:putative ABC transport system permease protein